jgi:hypothetical protein
LAYGLIAHYAVLLHEAGSFNILLWTLRS